MEVMNTAALVARLTDAQPLVMICAWCPTFDRTDPANKGASHGICPSCDAKLHAEMDAAQIRKAA